MQVHPRTNFAQSQHMLDAPAHLLHKFSWDLSGMPRAQVLHKFLGHMACSQNLPSVQAINVSNLDTSIWYTDAPAWLGISSHGFTNLGTRRYRFSGILCIIDSENPRVRKIICPQFCGWKWLRQFYGRMENCVLSAGKPPCP